MLPEDAACFGPVGVRLRDGRVLVLRPLAEGDGEGLAAFYAGVPRQDFRFYCPHALDREEAHRHAARADDPEHVCIVAQDDTGALVGYAWCQWLGGRRVGSCGICVLPAYQDCGSGGALMGRLVEVVSRIGPGRMGLTVQKANARAVALYQRMGFEVVGEGERPACWGFAAEPQYTMERAASVTTGEPNANRP